MKILKLVFLASLVVINGCGDLRKNKVIKPPLESSQFSANCVLDLDQFSEIMTRKIPSQINCLAENLRIFIRVVESGRENHLSRISLEQYLLKNRPNDFSTDQINLLKSVFDVNYLIFGDDQDYISKTSLESVVSFILEFNDVAAANYRFFNDTNSANYESHRLQRVRISEASSKIARKFREIYNDQDKKRVVNIEKIIESFRNVKNGETIAKIKKLLFLKPVLAGGESFKLTNDELFQIVMSFPNLSVMTFDLVRLSKIIGLQQKDAIEIFGNNVKILDDQIIFSRYFGDRTTERLFSMEEALEAAELLVDEDKLPLSTFRQPLKKIKEILMGGEIQIDSNETVVLGKDLKELLRRIRHMMNMGTSFHAMYENFKGILDQKVPVSINFNNYANQFPQHAPYIPDFDRISKNYRFYKGTFLSPYYSNDWYRNANGLVEIGWLEYAMKLIMNVYSSNVPTEDKPTVSKTALSTDEVFKIINDFKLFLHSQKIVIPTREESGAENVMLMGSLFQYQTDDNKMLDYNEGTEFGVSILTSLAIGDDLTNTMQGLCPLDGFKRVDPQCFREYFYPVFCDKFKSYYPRFFQYLGINDCKNIQVTNEMREFLATTEEVSRTCVHYDRVTKKEEVPFARNDMLGIFGSILNIEATFTKFDKNKNNIMDENEVDDAYLIYQGVLDSFVPKQVSFLKKKIFLYLINTGTVPDFETGTWWRNVANVLRFIRHIGNPPRTKATRKTIAKVLLTISQQNEKKAIKENKPLFDCQLLRDPENIPSPKE